ncbi:NUDIX hydrolase [Acinetobacter rongchengensis]|uniref:NUDIX domain-containing protein n=1 Tax=Acinetobacter rongchengensis TaxID=2419601 RepID=A0A3A8F308_9GAMM|nr:NUDIX domain-containing protein [Acinetobacter rongchengensis]RKG36694.1 NUDIX domain-containing protein [Acinetobacter rongchengensis]
MSMIKKVVPIVLRQQAEQLQILVFKHPLAGIQFVKGTVEQDESLESATLRELFEESGIDNVLIEKFIGVYSPQQAGSDWYVFLCQVNQILADEWIHYCADDGGLTLEFFWHPVFSPPTKEWHTIFQNLLRFLQKSIIVVK